MPSRQTPCHVEKNLSPHSMYCSRFKLFDYLLIEPRLFVAYVIIFSLQRSTNEHIAHSRVYLLNIEWNQL